MRSLFISGKIRTLWQPFSLAACHCFSPNKAPSSRETFLNISLSLSLLSQHILMLYTKVPYIEPFIITPHHIQFYFYRELRGPCCWLAPSRSLFFSVSFLFPSIPSFEVAKLFPFLENCSSGGWKEMSRELKLFFCLVVVVVGESS